MTSEREIVLRSLDGTRLQAKCQVPDEATGIVVMMHGLTTDMCEWNGFYSDLVPLLRQRGLASFRFDFRGHGKSEGDFKDVTVAGLTLDAKAAIREAMRITEKPLSILATSFGAGPAVFVARIQPEKVQRLALVAPALDYRATFLEPITTWGQETFRNAWERIASDGYVEMEKNYPIGARLYQEFELLDPMSVAGALLKPILVVHGDRDTMAPYEVSAKLSSRNKMMSLFTLPGADHGYVEIGDEAGISSASMRNRSIAYDALLRFLGGSK